MTAVLYNSGLVDDEDGDGVFSDHEQDLSEDDLLIHSLVSFPHTLHVHVFVSSVFVFFCVSHTHTIHCAGDNQLPGMQGGSERVEGGGQQCSSTT